MSRHVDIGIIVGTGEIGRIAAVAVLILAHETPFIYLDIDTLEQQEKVSERNLKEIVMQFTPRTLPEEFLEIIEVREYFPTKEEIILSQKVENTTPRIWSTQKFNQKKTRHPP